MSADDEALKRIAIGKKVEAAYKSKGLNAREVAALCNPTLNESSVWNIVRGNKVRPNTLKRVCEVLGLPFPIDDPSPYPVVDTLCRSYVSYRPSFDDDQAIHQSMVKIFLRDGLRRFEHCNRWLCIKRNRWLDYSQSGRVYVSKRTGIITLFTLWEGSTRSSYFNPPRTDGVLLGCAPTLRELDPTGFGFAVTPTVLIPKEVIGAECCGPIRNDDSAFEGAAIALKEADYSIEYFSMPD